MSASRWAELVAAWEASGETAVSFAARHGVGESSLRWWRTELVRRARREAPRRSPGPGRPPSPPVPLARVVREGEEMPTTTAAASQVAVVIGRVRIVVERGFDRQLLREVVGAFGDGA